MAIPPITPGDATSALTCPDCGWSGNTSQVVVDGDCWYCPECQQRIAPQAPVLTKDQLTKIITEVLGERCPEHHEQCMTCAAWWMFDRLSDEPSGAARCHGTDEGTWARCRLPSGHGGEHDFVEPFRPRITLEKLRAMRSTHGHGGPVVEIPGDAIARCCSCGASVKLVRQVYGYNICATCDDATSPLNRRAEHE